MEDKRLYRYDGGNVDFVPMPKSLTFIANHPVVLLVILCLCVSAIFYGISLIEKNCRQIVKDYELRIKELSMELNREIDKDSLEMRLIESVFDRRNGAPINDSVVWEYIKSCRGWYPEYVIAQCIIESGCGKSELAKKTNNLFGMRCIDQSKPHRPTTQIPGANHNGYGVYRNWEQSVIDRILWERYRFSYVTPTEVKYIDGLSNYAEDPTYMEKVKNISKKYKKKK